MNKFNQKISNAYRYQHRGHKDEKDALCSPKEFTISWAKMTCEKPAKIPWNEECERSVWGPVQRVVRPTWKGVGEEACTEEAAFEQLMEGRGRFHRGGRLRRGRTFQAEDGAWAKQRSMRGLAIFREQLLDWRGWKIE